MPRLHPRPIKSELLGVGSMQEDCFKSFPGDLFVVKPKNLLPSTTKLKKQDGVISRSPSFQSDLLPPRLGCTSLQKS